VVGAKRRGLGKMPSSLGILENPVSRISHIRESLKKIATPVTASMLL
jgi:hypothetical protein